MTGIFHSDAAAIPAPAALSIAAIVDLYERAQLQRAVEQARVVAQTTAAFGWAPTFDETGAIHVNHDQFEDLRSLAPDLAPPIDQFRYGVQAASLFSFPVIVDR